MKLVPVLALFLFAACSAGAAGKVPGTYVLDSKQLAADMIALQKGTPAYDEAKAKAAAEGIGKTMQATLEIKADGTAEMKGTFGDKKDDTKGTWKVDGDKITITTKENGKDDVRTGKIQDGTITVEMPAGPAAPAPLKMVFRKK